MVRTAFSPRLRLRVAVVVVVHKTPIRLLKLTVVPAVPVVVGLALTTGQPVVVVQVQLVRVSPVVTVL
jgi:hypothetical protein